MQTPTGAKARAAWQTCCIQKFIGYQGFRQKEKNPLSNEILFLVVVSGRHERRHGFQLRVGDAEDHFAKKKTLIPALINNCHQREL